MAAKLLLGRRGLHILRCPLSQREIRTSVIVKVRRRGGFQAGTPLRGFLEKK